MASASSEPTVRTLVDEAPQDAVRRAVETLVADATAEDGVAPLSEQGRLDVHRDHGVTHLVAEAGGRTVGYAQLVDDAAELAVAPAARRRGVGGALLDAVLATDPAARVWAHGELPAARALATSRGLQVVRELFLLARPLPPEGDPLPQATLPDGLRARPFEPGRDEDEWLRVNAAAFAHHAEQGRMTREDLDERTAQDWFDPAGLVLVVPDDDPGTVVASHWTKVHPAGELGDEPVGEVYVVGVDPVHQGRGLGRPVTLLGLHHLAHDPRHPGLRDVVLYVDGDNAAALKVYRSLGFSTRGTDRMWARTADVAGDTMGA
ncbi:mycothiol synthase [Lapillicoccus jejuensis]|uniref:Mycothiol acetyltransferase n=1 Tax=Lapillicoccus jejuensis TaxID=402171 RepID=A0A542E0I0_9MICO|nr:mycothiol synthase [Lapillicoccus jejuensis]TQJ08845.1 mycothiol synthase [Lapillicoccus jejuensis]